MNVANYMKYTEHDTTRAVRAPTSCLRHSISSNIRHSRPLTAPFDAPISIPPHLRLSAPESPPRLTDSQPDRLCPLCTGTPLSPGPEVPPIRRPRRSCPVSAAFFDALNLTFTSAASPLPGHASSARPAAPAAQPPSRRLSHLRRRRKSPGRADGSLHRSEVTWRSRRGEPEVTAAGHWQWVSRPAGDPNVKRRGIGGDSWASSFNVC